VQDAVLELLEVVVQKLPDKCRESVLQSGDDVAAAARTGRVIDLHSIAECASAGVYSATADPINAAAEDVRAVAAVLRAAAHRGVVPLHEAFEEAGEEVADTLEATWDAAVAERQSGAVVGGGGSTANAVEGAETEGGDLVAQAFSFAALRAQLVEQQEVEEKQHVEVSAAMQRAARVAPFSGDKVASIEALLSFEALAKEVSTTQLGCASA
jgi:hypothetical protein